jgi:hypothetical protein
VYGQPPRRKVLSAHDYFTWCVAFFLPAMLLLLMFLSFPRPLFLLCEGGHRARFVLSAIGEIHRWPPGAPGDLRAASATSYAPLRRFCLLSHPLVR